VSEDGLNFTKDGTNPIFRPTDDWCCGRAIDADVVAHDGKLFLYFATRDHGMKIQKQGVAYAPLGSDYSRDVWTQPIPGSILAPEFVWEGECIEAAATLTQDGKVYMFYGGSYNCTPQQIGCAVSEDGVFFKKLFTEPLIRCGREGEWNASESGHPYAFTDDDGRHYLFYQGSPDGGKTWYLSRCRLGFRNGLPYVDEFFN
jgi:beta-xylosidase